MNKLKDLIINHNKKFKLLLSFLIVIIVLFILWEVFVSKKYIFSKEEKAFYNAGEKYFEQRTILLPKNNGSSRSVSLKTLVDKEYIADVYIPKTKTSCDLDQSWVKVVNHKNSYDYYAYLECGNYKSKIDHTGPVITLNGKDEIFIEQNSNYKDAGIKSVIDDKDGQLDKSKAIKEDNVNTKKIGTYQVSYKVKDSLGNETIKQRTVKVIKSLNAIIKENTTNKVYSGDIQNNYLLYSGNLWRIVKENSDGSIKIVTSGSISNITYGSATYDKSNVNYWLNKYFYKRLYNTSYIDKKSTWCIDNVSDIKKAETCTNTNTNPVGMLTTSDWNNSIKDNATYLSEDTYSMLLNKNSDSLIYGVTGSAYYKFKTTDFISVRPVVNLKKGTYTIGGNGTYQNPYKLNDYKYGTDNSKLNQRLIGEYINYSGYLWRVLDKDSKGNTTIIMDNVLSSPTSEELKIRYADNTAVNKFNPNTKNNIGYIINRQLNSYISTDDLVKTTWSVPTINLQTNFNTWSTDKVNCYLSIPRSFDLYSEGYGIYYWLLDSTSNKGKIVFNASTGMAFEEAARDYGNNYVKLVVKLNSKVKIGKGTGTIGNPYKVK